MILVQSPPPRWLAALDARLRVIAAAALSVAVLTLQSVWTLSIVLAASLILTFVVFGMRPPWRRFLVLNVIMFSLIAVLPWSTKGTPLITLGGASYSREGFAAAIAVALRANTILGVVTVFIGTIEPIALGHALARLYIPAKLVQLFLFTVRYIDVFEKEYLQLRRAMSLRGFEPRLDARTLRAYGNLAGMLLVRAVERSERIHNAMRCRAFSGQFPLSSGLPWAGRDSLAATVVIVATAAFLAGDWYLAAR